MNKKFGPIIKDNIKNEERYIHALEELQNYANGSIIKKELNKQIREKKTGLDGEKEIIYQLKNSGMDMYVLHDVYLTYGDITNKENILNAQIDFLVITRKKTYVIECKNYSCDITITDKGDFIAHYPNNDKGIDSPYTQNERHLNVIKQIRMENKPITIPESKYEKAIDNNYINLVVFANNKCIINDSNAKDEVRNSVIKADQLINKIKEIESKIKDTRTDNDMEGLNNFYINKNEIEIHAYESFVKLMNKFRDQRLAELENKVNFTFNSKCPLCGNKLVLKTGTKGDYIGNRFIACKSYPKCNYLYNINNFE